LQPKVIFRIVSQAIAAGAPELLFTAPIEAMRKAMSKANKTIQQIDLVELNEAFAVQCLACQRELGIPLEKLNVNGGAIALGHPIGCSGTRVMVTLMHALVQRNLSCGMAALCLGGGEAVAVVIERVI
jgi:acetyl-CoA C-acetyltransferase